MGNFRLGSILGFEIRIDYSWFIIVALILWSFTAVVFPRFAPDLAQWTYIAMGVATTILFFASLLAHELSHSIVARYKGIPVEGITLFIFGGVSRTKMEAETPGDEFQIAGVGPLSSIVIGILFGLAWFAGTAAGWAVGVTMVFQTLAITNVFLAIFNLFPGFPLDGGRLFRSVVWKYTGDMTRATRIASTGGKWIAYLLMGYGLWQIFGLGQFIGGAWLIFIGWFLRSAAEAAYQQHLMRESMEGVSVKEAMTPNPETVQPELTLQSLVDDHFLRRRFQAYPVARNGHAIGLITLNQVKDIDRGEWPRRTVAETMLRAGNGLVARPDEDMAHVLERLESTDARRVLVEEEDGHLIGMITANDIADWLKRSRQLRGE